MVTTVVEGDQARDEIPSMRTFNLQDPSPCLSNIKEVPPFQALRVHTEDQQQVVYDEGTEEVALQAQRETELTAFFKLNEELQQEG